MDKIDKVKNNETSHSLRKGNYAYSIINSWEREYIILEKYWSATAKIHLSQTGERKIERKYGWVSDETLQEFLEYLNTKEKTKNTNKEIYNTISQEDKEAIALMKEWGVGSLDLF